MLRFLHFFHYLRRFLIVQNGGLIGNTGYFVNVRGTMLLGHVVSFARFARIAVFSDGAEKQFSCKYSFLMCVLANRIPWGIIAHSFYKCKSFLPGEPPPGYTDPL